MSQEVRITGVSTKPKLWGFNITHGEFWLDCRDRTCGVTQEYNYGGTPQEIYYGHVRTFRLDGHPKEEHVLSDLERYQTLLQRVCDGYESVWSGNNHVASYTQDADEAWDQLCRILGANQNYYEFWDIQDWVDPVMCEEIHADTTDEEIRQLAAEWVMTDPQVILGGGEDDIVELATEYRNELKGTEE